MTQWISAIIAEQKPRVTQPSLGGSQLIGISQQLRVSKAAVVTASTTSRAPFQYLLQENLPHFKQTVAKNLNSTSPRSTHSLAQSSSPLLSSHRSRSPNSQVLGFHRMTSTTKMESRQRHLLNFPAYVEAEQRRRVQDLNLTRSERREQILNQRRGTVVADANVNAIGNNLIHVLKCSADDETLIRQLFSGAENPPITEIAQSAFLPHVIECLERNDSPSLQLEAALFLTKLTSGQSEGTITVVTHGAVPIFVSLLRSHHDFVRRQAMLTLGNITCNSQECRNFVLDMGVLPPLLSILTQDVQLSTEKPASRILFHIWSYTPKPSLQQAYGVLPVLLRQINSTDDIVISDACWTLASFSDETDGDDGSSRAVADAGFCPRLAELLSHQSYEDVLLPTLFTVANIVVINRDKIQCVIDSGALPPLVNLLTTPGMERGACIVLLAITDGTRDQLQAAVEAGVLGPLVHLIENAEIDVKNRAVIAIADVTRDADQIKSLVQKGGIKLVCNLLNCPGAFLYSCSKILKRISRAWEEEKNLGTSEDFARTVLGAGGIDELRILRNHQSRQIREIAAKLLQLYDEIEDAEMVSPEDSSLMKDNHLKAMLTKQESK
ncbi:Importin subunit alpha-1a-like protein [Drosera capensis]